jgi:hypothetical protein
MDNFKSFSLSEKWLILKIMFRICDNILNWKVSENIILTLIFFKFMILFQLYLNYFGAYFRNLSFPNLQFYFFIHTFIIILINFIFLSFTTNLAKCQEKKTNLEFRIDSRKKLNIHKLKPIVSGLKILLYRYNGI